MKLTGKAHHKWNSDVYQHFKPAEILVQNGEKVRKGGWLVYTFACKQYVYVHQPIRHTPNMWIRNPSITRMHWAKDHSTGNLKCHVCECEPAETGELKAMVKFVAGFTYTPEDFRFQIATKHCHPFAIIEDKELLKVFQMLHALVNVPSWFSVG